MVTNMSKKNKKVAINVNLPESVRKEFKLICTELGLSYAEMIKTIVELWKESVLFRKIIKEKLGIEKYRW